MNEKLNLKEYKVLARKYRPQKFSDLIGQETLVETISSAIVSNRIAHAYLLTGVRGVGKTTTARLISMALNCESKEVNSYEPCGNCEICVSIKEDRNMDVIEMDAASKTGVEDVREIIENIKYKPINSKYKIFIIDEVHMLSISAFNALLKTLEEPPPHVKFLFATTETKKIPITIISRCQRFDLHRIKNLQLSELLFQIAKKEKIKIENDAMALIVRASDGSVRDALSLMDQAIVSENETITSSKIIQMLGLADRGKVFELIDEVFKGNTSQSLKIFNDLYISGADILMIFDEMLKIIHFITQLKISPEKKEDLNTPEFERNKGYEMSQEISMSSLGRAWQVLFKGYQELKFGNHLYHLGEMLIIRVIYLFDGPNPDDLVKKIQDEIQNHKVINSNNDSKEKESNNKTINYKVEEEEEIQTQSEKKLIKIKDYREFVNFFSIKREAILHSLLYNNVKLISFEEGKVSINLQNISDPNFSRKIAKLISTWTGRIWQVISSNSNVGKSLYEEDIINQQKEIESMKNDPDIKIFLEKYPGVTIHSISSIKESKDEKNLANKNKIRKE